MEFNKLDFGAAVPLSLQLAEILERKIRNREIATGQKLPTQEGLREIFKVSDDTVNGALSLLVKEGYISRRQRHGTFVINSEPVKTPDIKIKNGICLVICTGSIHDTIGNPDFNLLTNGAEERLKEKKLNLLYKTLGENDNELNFNGKEKDIAGLIIAGNITQRHIGIIKRTKLPFILIGEIYKSSKTDEETDIIASDDFQQTYLATKHLTGLGHRRILYLTYYLREYLWCKVSLEGYEQALKEAGLPIDKDLLFETKSANSAQHANQAYSIITEFWGGGMPFTGLICISGRNMYNGVMDAFKHKNIRVPEDVSVVCDVQMHGITSVSCDKKSMAETAVERLIQRLTNPGWKPERVVVPCKMQIGGSTRQLEEVHSNLVHSS